MALEFTDRYGGHAPSWLRGCFECEAMGVSPEWRGPVAPDGTMLLGAEPEEDERDDWEFVRCACCGGTGRVRWWRTVLRLPRWLYRGVRFVWDMGVVRNKQFRPLEWTWRQQVVLALQCAFLADLGLWRPGASRLRWAGLLAGLVRSRRHA